jgi:hypothetical protein
MARMRRREKLRIRRLRRERNRTAEGDENAEGRQKRGVGNTCMARMGKMGKEEEGTKKNIYSREIENILSSSSLAAQLVFVDFLQ